MVPSFCLGDQMTASAGKLVGMNYDLAALQCGAVGQMASLSGDWDFQSSSKVPVWVPVPAPTIRLSGSAKAPG